MFVNHKLHKPGQAIHMLLCNYDIGNTLEERDERNNKIDRWIVKYRKKSKIKLVMSDSFYVLKIYFEDPKLATLFAVTFG